MTMIIESICLKWLAMFDLIKTKIMYVYFVLILKKTNWNKYYVGHMTYVASIRSCLIWFM
jgi:hypothetical protein